MAERGEARPAKRQRQAAPVFPRGAIKRVRVHNFMTYTGTVEITPGPRLNLVLGPNGTGKSSLVCALCIGLGGSTKLLGRADNLRDYVQRGQDEAWTEVTLSGGGGAGQRDMVVRRDIRQVRKDDGSTGYSSNWRLNGMDTPQAEVQELVKGLNIQFDNLCQFLPQDRVVEFAGMNPHELLAATEKAIGDARLHSQHERLIALRQDATTRTSTLDALRRKLSKAEADNKALERDAERFKRRQTLLTRLEDVTKKETWLAVEAKQAKLAEDSGVLDKLKDMLARHQAQVADDTAPLKAARQRLKEAERQLKSLPAPPNAQSVARERSTLCTSVKKHADNVTVLTERINGLQAKHAAWLGEIADLQAKLAAKKVELDTLPPPVDHRAELNTLSAQGTALQRQGSELDEAVHALEDRHTHAHNRISNAQQRLIQLSSSRHRRLNMIDRMRPGLGGLHTWLEEGKRAGRFKGPVYGPLAIEMTVPDAASHAAVLEAAIKGMVFDFATTCREDEEAITAEAKQQGIFVRVHAFTRPLDSPYPRMAGPAAGYARYGVAASLDELVQAPPLVMQVLTSGPPALASAFIMGDESRIDELLDKTQVRTVYTPRHEHRVIKASYDTDNARQSSELRPARMLSGAGVNAAEQAREKELAEAAKAAAEAELASIERELAERRAKLNALGGDLKVVQDRFDALSREQAVSQQKLAQLSKAVSMYTNLLAQKQRQSDPLSSKPQLEAQCIATVTSYSRDHCALLDLVSRQWVGVRERGVLELAQREADMQVRALESATSERKRREAELKEKVAKMQRVVTAAQTAVDRAQRQADLEAPLSGGARARLMALPSDREELVRLRNGLEEELAAIVCNNPRALEEYTARQREIGEMAADVGGAEKALADINAEIDAIKGTWLPELQRVVGAINETFSASFRDIGCAGDITLDTADSEDYAKFAIQIGVKFREGEDLQLLTRSRQSGGERSVATILYLVALQGVTVTPFRVVDEINQGMDAKNERKVFGQLVAASTAEGTPQCFLLTPKLLPGLEYTRDITVLQILNGACTGVGGGPTGAKAWDIGTLLGAAALGPRAAALLEARG